MAMNRTETVLAYLQNKQDATLLQSILPTYKLQIDIKIGNIETAIADASQWTVAPDYIILDVSHIQDPIEALYNLAQEAPDGETEVIMVGDINDIEMYQRLLQQGVSDYLISPIDEVKLIDTFEKVVDRRRELTGSIDPKNLIVVTGSRGGVGASTVATALAEIVSNHHQKKTLLIDLDINGGTQYISYDVEPSPGLYEILQSPQRVDALFLERTLIKVNENLALLSAGAIEDGHDASEAGLAALLSQARQGIDKVVIDLPRGQDLGKSSLLMAGTVVIVCTLTLASLRETLSLIEYVENRGNASKIIIVTNRIGEHKSGIISLQEFSKQIRKEVIQLPFDPRSVTQSMMQARPLTSFRKPISEGLFRIGDKLDSAPIRNQGLLSKFTGR